MPIVIRVLMAFAAIFMVAPGVTSDLHALALMAPVLIQQGLAWRRERDAVPEVA